MTDPVGSVMVPLSLPVTITWAHNKPTGIASAKSL